MRRIAIAEWILSCTMPRDRARAAAGDIAEATGRLSFWTSLARLAGSTSARNFARSPVKFLGGALLLWCAFLLVSILYAVGGRVLWAFLYAADNHTGLGLITRWVGHRISELPPVKMAEFVALVIFPAVAAWKIGADVSRKSPGSELATWYAVIMTWVTLGLRAKLPALTVLVTALCVLGGMLRMRWLDHRASTQ